jgi:hypothetical protein
MQTWQKAPPDRKFEKAGAAPTVSSGLVAGDVSIVGEVKSLSLIHRFLIALHSLREVEETGLSDCSSENKPGNLDREMHVGHFLRSGLRTKVRELRRFKSIPRGTQPGFSTVQTVWRSAQSGAKPSPPKFPANREKYREFADFGLSKPHSCSLNCSFCGSTSLYSVIRNREFTGRIREVISRIREVLLPGLERRILRVKTAIYDYPSAPAHNRRD